MAEGLTASTQELERAALASLASAKSESELEDWRIAYLGRRGELSTRLRSVGSLPPEERREAGASLNRLKIQLTGALDEALQSASSTQRDAAPTNAIDITLPGRRNNLGGLHPSEMMMREILEVFNDMGFQTVEGPIVELEKYNFDMLNIPGDHPARDLQEYPLGRSQIKRQGVAPNPDVTDADPNDGETAATGEDRFPGTVFPLRSYRRHPRMAVPSNRGSSSGRGRDHVRSQRARSTNSHAVFSERNVKSASDATTSPS